MKPDRSPCLDGTAADASPRDAPASTDDAAPGSWLAQVLEMKVRGPGTGFAVVPERTSLRRSWRHAGASGFSPAPAPLPARTAPSERSREGPPSRIAIEDRRRAVLGITVRRRHSITRLKSDMNEIALIRSGHQAIHHSTAYEPSHGGPLRRSLSAEVRSRRAPCSSLARHESHGLPHMVEAEPILTNSSAVAALATPRAKVGVPVEGERQGRRHHSACPSPADLPRARYRRSRGTGRDARRCCSVAAPRAAVDTAKVVAEEDEHLTGPDRDDALSVP